MARHWIAIGAAAWLAAGALPVSAQDKPVQDRPAQDRAVPDAEEQAHLRTAQEALEVHDLGRAAAELDQALAAYATLYASEKRTVYCGMSGTQTLLYMTMAAQAKKEAVAIEPGWCVALYLRGYVQVDRGDLAGGRSYYQRALAMAPMHWQYLGEMGYTYRDTDPQRSLDLYKQAQGVVALIDKDRQPEALAWTLRGQGYALSELKQFDQAASLYRECLKTDPDDRVAQHELAWIAEQKKGAGQAPPTRASTS